MTRANLNVLTSLQDPEPCMCCGKDAPIRGANDPWEGRLDGYCYKCALTRCDAYPSECTWNKDDGQ